MGFGGISHPKHFGLSSRPKRHFLARNRAFSRIDRQNRSTVATCRRGEETKKTNKKKKSQTVIFHACALTTHVDRLLPRAGLTIWWALRTSQRWGPTGKRGAFETPKASRGTGMGRGCPLPSRLWGLGERRKLPQRGLGRSPGRKRILVKFELEKYI